MADRAAVVFLFAEEKLLFRYPFTNPFTINLDNNTTTTGVVSAAVTNENPCTQADIITSSGTSTNRLQVPSTGGVRCKPRSARRTLSMAAVATASPSTKCKADDADDEAPRLTTSMLPSNSNADLSGCRSGANNSNDRGNGSIKGGGSVTCVGIETAVLLHLLRAGFVACTTIQFAGVTFLIYPFLPGSTKSHQVALTSLRPPRESNADPTDDREVDSQRQADSAQRVKFLAGQRDNENFATPDPARVVLVVAMSRPDCDDGRITNFVQIFMNVLLREELRTRYVTCQLHKMEGYLRTWRTCGDKDESESLKNSAAFSGPNNVTGGNTALHPPSDLEMYERLSERDDLSLCKEITQLVCSIMAATSKGPTNSTGNASPTTTNPPKALLHSSKIDCKGSANTIGLGESRANYGITTGFTIRDLFGLPVELLAGYRATKRCPAFANARLNSNYIVTIEDDSFVERLAKPYGEAVGRRAAQLLPLSAIWAAITTLPPPLRVGTLYRELERTFAGTSQTRHVTKSQQHGSYTYVTNSSTNTSGAAAEEQSHIADCDILVVEAVEFLRACGVLTIDTELTVIFTHCDISPASGAPHVPEDKITRPCRPQPSQLPLRISTVPTAVCSAASIRIIPASAICMMLLEGLRQSASFGFDTHHAGVSCERSAPSTQPDVTSRTPTSISTLNNTSPSPTLPLEIAGSRERDTHSYSVYCSWGDACPICEELAAASYLWSVGGAPVGLVFPFLSAPIVEAANRRARQGVHSFDRDCCSLLTDQAPWFTSMKPLKAGVTLTSTSPHQLYRELVDGYNEVNSRGAAVPEDAKAGSESKDRHGEKGNGKFNALGRKTLFGSGRDCRRKDGAGDFEATVLTPGGTPGDARAWLAANRDAIESRLNAEKHQRWLLRARIERSKERQRGGAGAVSTGKCRDDGNTNTGGRSKRLSPQPHQRYRKREVVTSRSIPNTYLPLAPTAPLNSAKFFTQPQAQMMEESGEASASTFPYLADDGRAVSVEVLMQVVLHHTVALLWGKARMNVDTLLWMLECNLRRLPSFLAGVRRQKAVVANSANGIEQLDETPAPSVGEECTHAPAHPSQQRCGKGCSEGGVEGRQEKEADLQFHQASAVFSELLLLDKLMQCSHLTLDAIPTKLLFHAVVNSFSDVLLIGRGDSG
ncbi:hypothetical protein, conserved [Trypanosoma brucei gambiense DAL972]|uniref:Uncharacterized protein n=1 Tax=Trypanosoma brucei gambiense (strain MHOM/CI/86/DAL972) TaxID=679716 RepID=D0A9B3_TRYB9|nr:hypothetical protein, conserved [Trypanosoma brucei gambiense DAL972]CBH18264.1 hypothetical protein, conserved [Trypanosoma brucei gambiense DAL972]|eukprot:XP_011780528.1 hypothetical protein, conserved [Trypanosoma brucei gambiense DAL972]